MRLFFGLEVDAATAMAIADWRDRQFSAAARPVSPANFHITLAFVGEVSQRQLADLLEATDHMLGEGAPPSGTLHLDQTGYWPRPGIYWLGPSSWADSLTRLAGKLQRQAGRLGTHPESRAYQPHITLFRGCEAAPPMPAQAPDFELSYAEFSLFESRRGRGGNMHYEVLASWGETAP